jgi:hypothetical protein
MENLVKNSQETSVKGEIISIHDLYEKLVNITKSTVISLTYLTDHAQSKTVKGQKQVQKLVRINNVYLNHDYTKKVQKLTGNSDFEAQELKGKSRISSTILQSDKSGEFLLDGKVLYKESVKLLSLFHNNNEISKETAEEMDLFTPAYYKENPTTTAGRGTVSEEDDFKIINISLTKIQTIKIAGTEYRPL